LLLSIAVTNLGRWVQGKWTGFDLSAADIPATFLLFIEQGEPKYVGVAWSLQFEILFYVVFLLLLLSRGWGFRVFMAWGLIVVLEALGVFRLNLPFALSNTHCFQFLAGVLVGWLARVRTGKTSFANMWLAGVLVVLGVVFEVYGPLGRHTAAGRLVLGCASAYLIYTLVFCDGAGKIKVPHWLVRVGSVSYTIYLAHILLISVTYMVLLKLGLYHVLPEALVYAIAVGVAVLGSCVLGFWVELPMVRFLKNRFFYRVGTD
jgi:peptidoglycan/LPS O-acetylase OafA/YrhL